jgi:hypothetical protein
MSRPASPAAASDLIVTAGEVISTPAPAALVLACLRRRVRRVVCMASVEALASGSPADTVPMTVPESSMTGLR